jgi:hypothetical protein
MQYLPPNALSIICLMVLLEILAENNVKHSAECGVYGHNTETQKELIRYLPCSVRI